jgi:hypothetical protein
MPTRWCVIMASIAGSTVFFAIVRVGAKKKEYILGNSSTLASESKLHSMSWNLAQLEEGL